MAGSWKILARILLKDLAKNTSERSCQDPQILAYVVAIIPMNYVFLAIELVAFWQNPTKPVQAIVNHRQVKQNEIIQ